MVFKHFKTTGKSALNTASEREKRIKTLINSVFFNYEIYFEIYQYTLDSFKYENNLT